MGVDWSAYSVIGVQLDEDFVNDFGDNEWGESKVNELGSNSPYGYVFGGSSYSGDFQHYFGLTYETDEWGTRHDIDGLNIDKVKEDLKSILEPLGQWEEKNFGIWTVLYSW